MLPLSFSIVDALKFKQTAGSMQFAFGVQHDIKANEIPKGSRIITREFSHGGSNPAVLSEAWLTTKESIQRFYAA